LQGDILGFNNAKSAKKGAVKATLRNA